ncbi:MAG: homogentisate 1,2-dioxygenase [Gammaproteobacteria bacterium]|nr:homogentisate 1,2-dioxygenase [Gammaproteobacteria bacterium]
MSKFVELTYHSGFTNEHCSEALTGTLPIGQFSPQQVPFGLYAEKFSATAFTAPRHQNRRTWFYRIRPSVLHGAFSPLPARLWRTAPLNEGPAIPDQLRWDPLPMPTSPCDFIDGMVSMAATGNAALQLGMAAHVYAANQSMANRYFYNADAEMLILPQLGRLLLLTECGQLPVAPGEMALIPRGMKFRVELPDQAGRGYVCENYGALLRLPERGPVGSDGFANDRDFLAPHAWFEDREGEFELVCKFGGHFYRATLDHSPLDVVGWIGTAAPYKYDLSRFNVINTVSFDHPDPSIFTVLTAPSDTPGVANLDFVIFPPRWLVAEHTFRPPWFHRNVMSEFMGLIHGKYDAKERGFEPGGVSLHNCMSAHGPEQAAYAKATNLVLTPAKLDATLAFMFESRYVIQTTQHALQLTTLQTDYRACWDGLAREFQQPGKR